jgi:FkbM family methyltransferase
VTKSEPILSGNFIKQLVNKNLWGRLDFTQSYEIIFLAPLFALTPSRLDVIAKYIYGWHLLHDGCLTWAEYVYLEHLRVWNPNFTETDGSGKTGFNKYREDFVALLGSMRNSGHDASISILPLDNTGNIIDGSHRLAAALLLDHNVPTVGFSHKPKFIYDYRFFQDRGLDEDILDDMVYRYLLLKSNTRLLFLFPCVEADYSSIIDFVHSELPVIGLKRLATDKKTMLNLLYYLYQREPWLNPDIPLAITFAEHLRFRSCGTGEVVVLAVEADSDKIAELKARLRSRYTHIPSNYTMHSNDSYHETRMLAALIFNRNGRHYLQYADVTYRADARYARLEQAYLDMLPPGEVAKEYFALCGSTVLSTYGLRQAGDIDYLTTLDDEFVVPDGVGCHNAYVHYYKKSVSELVHDPRNFFYTNGIKYVSLPIILNMKKNRAEDKDLADISLCNRRLGRMMAIEISFYSQRRKLAEIMHRIVIPRIRNYVPKSLRRKLKLWFGLGPDASMPGRGLADHSNYMGFTVFHPPGTSLISRLTPGVSVYEYRLFKALSDELVLHHNPVFFDVGANIGLMTANILHRHPGISVHIFEPSPSIQSHLTKTLASNPGMSKVVFCNAALGASVGKSEFSVHDPIHASGDGFRDTGRAGDTQVVPIAVTTLDLWCGERQTFPSVIKMDVEGAEYLVLKGADTVLKSTRPTIFFEAHPDNLRAYDHSIEDLWALFETYGYMISTLDGTQISRDHCESSVLTVHDFVARPCPADHA